MSSPEWGEAPNPDVMARVLAERYGLAEDERFEVDLEDDVLVCRLVTPRETYAVRVAYESGAGERPVWPLLVDATDALVGTLIDGDREHRQLPQGSGVEYDGARLNVQVDKDVPELRRLADKWLSTNGSAEPD